MSNAPSNEAGSLLADARREWTSLSTTQKTELAKLVVTPIVAAVLGYVLLRRFGVAWAAPPYGTLWHLFYGAVWTAGLEVGAVVAVGVGVYLGLVGLVLLDEFKRTEGMILLGVTVVGAAGLANFGILVTSVDWIEQVNLLAAGIVAGALLGGAYGGVTDWKQGARLRFPAALRRIFQLLVVFVVVGFLEAHLLHTSPIVARPAGGLTFQVPSFDRFVRDGVIMDVVASAALLYVVDDFSQYERDTDVMFIGPIGSGKSTLMVGLLRTLSDGAIDPRPNGPLIDLENEFLSEGDLGATQQQVVRPLRFEYKQGTFFPRRVTVYAIDFAGEKLDEIDPLEPAQVRTDSLQEVYGVALGLLDDQGSISTSIRESEKVPPDAVGFDYDPVAGEGVDDKLVTSLIEEAVFHADVLGSLYPADELEIETPPAYAPMEDGDVPAPRDRNLSLEQYSGKYTQIEQFYDDPEMSGEPVDVVPVVTAADYLAEDFRTRRGVDPMDDPHAFREFVTSRLAARDPRFDGRDGLAYPVFFDVKERVAADGNGGGADGFSFELNTNPEKGPVLRGAHHLLERLGR